MCGVQYSIRAREVGDFCHDCFCSWTTRNGSRGYIAVVVHWLDTSSERRTMVTGFEPQDTVEVNGRDISTHAALCLSKLLANVLGNFVLKRKLCFVLGDNASVNLATTDEPIFRQDSPTIPLPFSGKISFCRCLADIITLRHLLS